MNEAHIHTVQLTSADLPQPCCDERPACYAERLGAWYATATSSGHKKEHGQYLTPVAVADFMAQSAAAHGETVRILEPGAGAGVLTAALCERLIRTAPAVRQIVLDLYELDQELALCLRSSLSYLQRWLDVRNVALGFRIHTEDFVLKNAASLNDAPQLFTSGNGSSEDFDIVVMNPPYFKIPKSDPRAQAAAAVVHGQPNIYAIFLALGAALLKPGGELIAITPRSFAAGPYFRRFREYFFSMMQPCRMHLFGSRRDAFAKDEVLQENLILVARRHDEWGMNGSREASVVVSTSAGIGDIADAHERPVPLAEIVDIRSREKILRIPVSAEDDAITEVIHSWSGSLRSYGLAISTGPVVAFRATQFLADRAEDAARCAPLLWMQNVRPMQVAWPVSTRNKAQYIEVATESLPLLVPARNYVVMRRFSAKEDRRRIVVAPFLASQFSSPFAGLENHLNYIHRPGGSLSDDEAFGLAALLGSTLIDRYFRISNGNTQVSATELRAMPLPPMERIVEIGSRVRAQDLCAEQIDAVVEEVIRMRSSRDRLLRSHWELASSYPETTVGRHPELVEG